MLQILEDETVSSAHRHHTSYMLTLYLFSSKGNEDFLPPLQPQQLESWHLTPVTTHRGWFFFYNQQKNCLVQPKMQFSCSSV